MPRDPRKHRRISVPGTVRLSWTDAQGAPKYANARFRDVSEAGIRVELPESVPVRTYVTVSAEKLGINTTACVRNSVRIGGKFLLGIEFNSPIKTIADRFPEQ